MGNVYLQKTWNGGMLTDWQTLPAPDLTHFPVETVMPDMTNAKPYKIGDDAFDSRRGFAWFQASIPYDPGHLPFLIDFNGVDDNAIVYINGRRAAQQDGYDVEFDAPLGGLIRKDTTNVVTVLVQNTDGGGGISKPVELEYDSASRILLADWSMKGGPGNFTSPEGWKTLDASTAFDRPYFYKNSFIVKNLHTTSKSMYRVTFEGLGHGSIWINGHNIGRYPEKIPVNSLYIPECWLIAGENSIVVYDEDGKTPGKIRIEAEKEASRDVIAQSF
jgi:beta-galactosidase